MALTCIEHPEDAVVEIRLHGRVTPEEYSAIINKMQTSIDAHGTIKFIEIIDDVTGVDPATDRNGETFDLRNFRRASRIAVVSDGPDIGPVSKTAGTLLPTRLRMFDKAHLEEARAWIRAPELVEVSA